MSTPNCGMTAALPRLSLTVCPWKTVLTRRSDLLRPTTEMAPDPAAFAEKFVLEYKILCLLATLRSMQLTLEPSSMSTRTGDPLMLAAIVGEEALFWTDSFLQALIEFNKILLSEIVNVLGPKS